MTTHTAGERLFSRYAYSPNELGNCGPADIEGLAAVARGEDVDFDVRATAPRIWSAWPYLVVIGKMLNLDPLDERVVRGYWTGSDEVAALDGTEFWVRLLSLIKTQAGRYWQYLDEKLVPEAAPSHAFHVLGVYPWSRMLDTNRQEPLQVLTNCCIRSGRVIAARADHSGTPILGVSTQRLIVYDNRLVWQPEGIDVPALFDNDIRPGQTVAIHWGTACDRLTPDQTRDLAAQLTRQVGWVNARLGTA